MSCDTVPAIELCGYLWCLHRREQVITVRRNFNSLWLVKRSVLITRRKLQVYCVKNVNPASVLHADSECESVPWIWQFLKSQPWFFHFLTMIFVDPCTFANASEISLQGAYLTSFSRPFPVSLGLPAAAWSSSSACSEREPLWVIVARF